LILRYFVHSYFLIFSIGIYLSGTFGIEYLKGIVFFLSSIYIFQRLLRSNIFTHKFELFSLKTFLFLYVLLYSALSLFRASSGFSSIFLAPVLFIHLLFWNLLYTSKVYKNNSQLLFRDIYVSLFILMSFTFINAWYVSGSSFHPGSIHNIAEKSNFIYSDYDVPMLSLICFFPALSMLQCKLKNISGGALKNVTFIILSFLLVILVQYFMGRRSHLALIFIAILFSLLPKSKQIIGIYITLLSIPFIPIFWTFISEYLIEIVSIDYINKFMVRGDVTHFATATFRLKAWILGIKDILNFDYIHLIGYGDIPQRISLNHNHMHNLYLNLILEAGFITTIIVFIIFFKIIKMTQDLYKTKDNKNESLSFILLYILSINIQAPFESILMSYSTMHLIFISIAITICNYLNEIKKLGNLS